MATSKTIRVDLVKTKANEYLAFGKPHDGRNGLRDGCASLLETILHATGNYRGFNYLESPYQEGVTDTSRRFYY